MDDFTLNCFKYLEGDNYTDDAYNNLVVKMIGFGTQYLATLDNEYLYEFKTIEERLNGIITALNRPAKMYGEEFLKFYKRYHNIENN